MSQADAALRLMTDRELPTCESLPSLRDITIEVYGEEILIIENIFAASGGGACLLEMPEIPWRAIFVMDAEVDNIYLKLAIAHEAIHAKRSKAGIPIYDKPASVWTVPERQKEESRVRESTLEWALPKLTDEEKVLAHEFDDLLRISYEEFRWDHRILPYLLRAEMGIAKVLRRPNHRDWAVKAVRDYFGL